VSNFALFRRVFGQRQRIQMVQQAATRQQVRASQPQLPRGASAENETPPRLVGIVERLHPVEDRRHRLRLVHENELPLFVRRQAPAGLSKFPRIAQMPRTLLWIGQVEAQGIFRNQLV
jgi:hypothetical protein